MSSLFARYFAILSLIVLVLGVNGCAITTEPTPGHDYFVTVDSRFTSEERAELETCAKDWRTFSSGAVSIFLIEGEGDLVLKRQGPSPGGYVRRDRIAWIDAESLYAAGFDSQTGVRAMCMNLVGQFFGIDLHDEPGALSRNEVLPTFTDADRRACQAASVCS